MRTMVQAGMAVGFWALAGVVWGQVPADPMAARMPPINRAPGPEYADAVRQFQGIPGIERAGNGRLWAVWYGGGITENEQNYLMLVTSGDDGKTWSSLKMVVDPDGDGPVRAFDPCLWHDPQGRLWLFWAQRLAPVEKPAELLAMVTKNPGDEEPEWSQPRWICDGVMMNKPTVRADGRWLLPVSLWFKDNSARVIGSSDQGASWQLVGAANTVEKGDRTFDEHMIIQRQDGSLGMLVRTRYGIGQSTSSDGGQTWSDVVPSGLPHPSARFFIRRLNSGKLLLVKHCPPDQKPIRSHLTALLSEDDGKTWKGNLLLDERNGVSYPDSVQAPDGTIYLIYDFARYGEKKILLATFTEEDVRRGEAVSERARLRVLVNQATGVTPKQP